MMAQSPYFNVVAIYAWLSKQSKIACLPRACICPSQTASEEQLGTGEPLSQILAQFASCQLEAEMHHLVLRLTSRMNQVIDEGSF